MGYPHKNKKSYTAINRDIRLFVGCFSRRYQQYGGGFGDGS